MSDTEQQEQQEKQVGFYPYHSFPYITPYGYGTPPLTVPVERATAIKEKAKELNLQYRSFKDGAKVAGFEFAEAEIDALVTANVALAQAREAVEKAQAAIEAKFAEQPAAGDEDANAVTLQSYLEASKREGQRVVCAAMVEAFPELAVMPKYKAVAEGHPTQVGKLAQDAGNDDGGEESGEEGDGAES